MLWILKKKRIPIKYVILVKNMHTNIMISVRVCDDESNALSINIKLYETH
jgi:hypothetical protein